MTRVSEALEVVGLMLVAVGSGLLHLAAGLIVGGALMTLYANYGLPGGNEDGEA